MSASQTELVAKHAAELAEVASQRDGYMKQLSDKEMDNATIAAAGEGTEALTAQLHALRGAQASEVEAVTTELENERQRHAGIVETLRAELEAERAQVIAADGF